MTATHSPPASLRDFRSVLIVKPSSLGDIVHTLPAARLLKQTHPQLRLRWVTNSEWLPLVAGCPFVDEAVEFPRKRFRGLAGGGRALAWAARLNRAERETPEIVLDFQGLLRSALVSVARGADWIAGLSDGREGSTRFYDQVADVNAQAHAVDRYLGLAHAAGARAGEVIFDLPAGLAPAGFDQREPFLILHACARGEGKALSPAVLQTLCDCLTSVQVVLVGVSSEVTPVQGAHIRDLRNRTSLLELTWLMRQARACVSVDSGPMHLAAAVNARVLGIHTWTDPRKVGPYDPRAWTWKGGRIAHRDEFTDEECARSATVTEPDARRIADFILGTLTA